MTRRKVFSVVATAAVSALALAACGGGGSESGEGGGGDAETVIKLAFNQTAEHPQYIAAMELGEKLSEATDGRYSIEVYPNEELGTQSDVVQSVSDGSVEMMWAGAPILESFNEDFIAFNLPYVFDSLDAQAAVLSDEAVVGDLYASLEESKDITVLAGVSSGIRNVYNSVRPITEPADLDGLAIRVQQSDSQVAMIEAMGAVASPMGQGEVYSALQTGALDGAENNESVFFALKHNEVATYYSYTQHLMLPDYLLINTSFLDSMSEEDRQALLDLIPETVDAANTGMVEFSAESRASAEAQGAEFNEDVDVAAFRELVQPLVDESINNDVRQALYDAVLAANEDNS